MGEVQAADAGRPGASQILGQLDAGRRLGVEQIEQRPLLRVVGPGRIAGRGADAAILLGDQLVVR